MARKANGSGDIVVLPKGDFGLPDVHPELLKRALETHATNQRQGTSSTQSRYEVTGSTAKLYRQKGTGRARAGSANSPTRRGGSVAFGPRPRQIRAKMSRRDRKSAVRGVLAAMTDSGCVSVTNSWGDSSRTRDRAAWIKAAGLQGRILLVDVEPPEELRRSARNIPDVQVVRADSMSFYEVAVADHIVASEAALALLRARVMS